jgi:hypothetical protein
MSKRMGRKSQAQNDFLPPLTPVSVSATDVGTNRSFNNGAATVTFSLPGGSPAATSFTVTSSPGGFTATGASSPLTVQGLQSETSYTFTVTATNASGTSAASSASAAVTATTVPQAPTASAANVGTNRAFGNGAATITASAVSGGKTVSSFSASGVSGASPLTVQSLAGGTAYTFSVTATNANGTSTATTTNSITATTVPATPAAPGATAGINQDTVSWSPPANGGSAITSYVWAASDGKSGSTASTSVVVGQEANTSQTYTVRAINANGTSGTSSASNSVSTLAPPPPVFTPPPPVFTPPPSFSGGGVCRPPCAGGFSCQGGLCFGD